MDALCVTLTLREKMMSDRSTRNGSREKIGFDPERRN